MPAMTPPRAAPGCSDACQCSCQCVHGESARDRRDADDRHHRRRRWAIAARVGVDSHPGLSLIIMTAGWARDRPRSPAGRAGMRARACMHSDRVRSHVSLTRCPLFSLQPRDARAAAAASARRAHVMRLAACALTLLAVVHVPAATSGGGGGGGGGDGPTIHSTRTATRPGLWKSA